MPITGTPRVRAWHAALLLVVAACGSDPATPPPSATPVPTPDPRLEEVAEGRGVWVRQRPSTVAYTTTEMVSGLSTTTVRVTEMDGRAEVQAIEVGSYPPAIGADQTIDAILDRADAALGTEGVEVTIAYDPQYGYITRLEQSTPGVADGTSSVEVRDLTTPADRTSASRARDQLDALLQAWRSPRSPTWEYTWSRFTAADTAATATTYRVHHEDGQTTVATADGAPGSAAPPDEATIQGTVETAVGVLAAGGWVDVAVDAAGLDALIAMDPSPSATGDASWIRIAFTDLYLTRAREALASARGRWAAAGLERYAYRWRYEGASAAWGWTISINRDAAKLRPGKGAPPVESSFVAPRIDALFDLVDGLIAGGGTVRVTYDETLGYPRTVIIDDGRGAAPAGTITISGFKTK